MYVLLPYVGCTLNVMNTEMCCYRPTVASSEKKVIKYSCGSFIYEIIRIFKYKITYLNNNFIYILLMMILNISNIKINYS
jgi:hypothetical protein